MNVLLTGATSGIGLETLKRLVEQGDVVYAIGRDFQKIEKFYNKNQEKIKKYKFDFNEISEIKNLFSLFDLGNDKFDAMIHCASIEETLPLSMYSPERVKKIFDLNVFAGIELLRHFTKKKYSYDGASALFLSSVMGILGQPGKIGYCSTKAAVIGMVRSSALEFVKRKIRINCVLPGIVKTPMTQKLFTNLNKEHIQQIENMHPLGLGEVEDVVPMILFLISSNSKWITGQEFVIDGGYSIL